MRRVILLQHFVRQNEVKMESEKKYTVEDLARITNRSKSAIYRLAKRLGRLPTIEEIENRKTGRPNKY